ncbi:hypothetical protein TREMEDRAFT_27740 [Tremella mesenterica DSM 1558]|uniref:uncharacterized protein n=1 Tax=Tremella mesenterica (strain ATCC 24925 / CBS 8224 / DSM 1558 / NBRC 9311 / NRRL Y-6157 / RJB 2259-6 / UBC 559-6) TaxID=578456 RepID=UPI0003F4A2C4|nr:uncharacterized protein TREMEDRAFT_27740 [Tremella mesenterica DSM 1558]EIW71508.1 hypothetical protein TREMEDRAFT_27740 [Tremella mesenterica DSM 1558]
MASKSIFRQPGAQHFQLVHRSLRDPLIDDPDAPQRVLKAVDRPNEKKSTYTLADLETTLDKKQVRDNEGEAALYGITYDDSSYDYMAHLRPIGAPGASEVVLIPGPRGSGVAKGMKTQARGKGKGKDDELFDLLPPEVLPGPDSKTMQEVWASQEAVPPELQGLQPDMDPHLRQVLEALEDDAFVDDEGDGEWFEELVKGGEAKDGRRAEYEFVEWGAEKDEKRADKREEKGGGEGTWENMMKAFKSERKPSGSDEEESEMADTVGSLASNMKDMMVLGGKKRRGKRGPSDATGMSMSSSSMWRNEGLRTLDEQFDQLGKQYELDEEDFPDDVSVAASTMTSMTGLSTSSRLSLLSHASRAPPPPPELTRDDFEAIMDDFLDNYEILGSHMRPSLGSTSLTGPEKLRVLRNAIDSDEGVGKEENRRRIMELERITREYQKEDRDKLPMREIVGKDRDQWDAQTIISTYTNTENHPAVIRTKRPSEMKKAAAINFSSQDSHPRADHQEDDESDSGSETERETPTTITRIKGETTQERKARKSAVKADRASRRQEKREHRETFSSERKRQLNAHKRLVGGGKAADLNIVSRGVLSLS